MAFDDLKPLNDGHKPFYDLEITFFKSVITS